MPDHLQASPEFASPNSAKFKSRKKAANSPGLDLQRISFYDDDILNGTRTLNTQATSNQQTRNEANINATSFPTPKRVRRSS